MIGGANIGLCNDPEGPEPGTEQGPFLFAMYEKNGQPLEVFLGHLIQNKFIRPKVRIYQTNNLYSALVRQSQLEQEVKRIARKGRKTGKA